MPLLDVLDLPQLYTKPTAKDLLDTLVLLTLAPPSWETSNTSDNHGPENIKRTQHETTQISPEGVTRYLTGIVSSDLRWIHSDEAKEEIWDLASARLSERSGRTAMRAMSRQFRIPSPGGSFELNIHEPTMTGDDLGLKTWAASYLLAKRLHTFQLVNEGNAERLQVLELGSGTGLVGLAMAGLGADVVLTDLPNIHPNLARNAQDNAMVIAQNNGSTKCGVLDWNLPTSLEIPPISGTHSGDPGISMDQRFKLILAADSLYSPDHPRMLVDSIATWLSEEIDAKVIIEFPYRDAYMPEIKDFRERMGKIGLRILEEGEEKGYDDWGGSRGNEDDEEGLVTCWWSCWGRAANGTEGTSTV